MINIIDILNNAIKTNRLKLTFSQLNWISNYIKKYTESIQNIKYLVLIAINDGFKLSDIPTLILKIANIVKDSCIVYENDIPQMNLILVKFIITSIIEAVWLPLSSSEKDQADILIISSLDLLDLNIKQTIEKDTESFFSKHACCW